MPTAPCPECNRAVHLADPSEGQRIVCPHCGAKLEVLNLEPLEFDWAYNEPQFTELWQEIERCQG